MYVWRPLRRERVRVPVGVRRRRLRYPVERADRAALLCRIRWVGVRVLLRARVHLRQVPSHRAQEAPRAAGLHARGDHVLLRRAHCRPLPLRLRARAHVRRHAHWHDRSARRARVHPADDPGGRADEHRAHLGGALDEHGAGPHAQPGAVRHVARAPQARALRDHARVRRGPNCARVRAHVAAGAGLGAARGVQLRAWRLEPSRARAGCHVRPRAHAPAECDAPVSGGRARDTLWDDDGELRAPGDVKHGGGLLSRLAACARGLLSRLAAGARRRAPAVARGCRGPHAAVRRTSPQPRPHQRCPL